MKVYINRHNGINTEFGISPFWYICKYKVPPMVDLYGNYSEGEGQQYLHRDGNWHKSTGYSNECGSNGCFAECQIAEEIAKHFGFEVESIPPAQRSLEVIINSYGDGTYCVIFSGLTEKQIIGFRRAFNSNRVSYEIGDDINNKFQDSLSGYKNLKEQL